MAASSKKHIVLTSHHNHSQPGPAIEWGAQEPMQRGPVIGTLTSQRNVIGTHSGAYAIYRALAVASGSLASDHKPDLTNTAPIHNIGPFDSWHDNQKIVSLDPFGATVQTAYSELLEQGYDIRPTIAVTKAHIEIPELHQALSEGRLKADGKVILDSGACVVTKAAIEPVWFLPGIAQRFEIKETDLRRSLFESTGGMYPELVTRQDLKVFLPPIGGITIYGFGDISQLGKSTTSIACRVHDECNGSDVFGSDICTCRPYLIHGIEICISRAQEGGVGLIVYNRKEGRALGEVTKFLVYNARKRQEGGDTAKNYFERTECIAGVQDMRFQELMPDSLHWLGIKHIDTFVSMSDMKYNALVHSGITVGERVSIPEDKIPPDAKVEMDAKKAAGYYSDDQTPTEDELNTPKGRGLHD